MDIVKLQLKPRVFEAVHLTDKNMAEVRNWVQAKLPFHQVVGNDKRLYLPSVGDQTDILEPGDWLFFDPVDLAFRGALDDAVQLYYEEVHDEAPDPEE